MTWSAVTGRLIRDRAAHREGLGLLGGGDVVVSARALQEARWLLRRSEDARPPVEALPLAYMVAIWRADRDQLSRLILAWGRGCRPSLGRGGHAQPAADRRGRGGDAALVARPPGHAGRSSAGHGAG